MTAPESNSDIRRQGPLNPEAGDGVVVVENPPAAPMHMTPDEADISGIRMLDAADRSRHPPKPGRGRGRDSGQ
jgi:hypothetical protein